MTGENQFRRLQAFEGRWLWKWWQWAAVWDINYYMLMHWHINSFGMRGHSLIFIIGVFSWHFLSLPISILGGTFVRGQANIFLLINFKWMWLVNKSFFPKALHSPCYFHCESSDIVVSDFIGIHIFSYFSIRMLW